MKNAKVETLRAAMNRTQGRFFTVTFKKKDNTLRTMNARLGVKKHLKGGVSTTSHISKYQTVYEGKERSYKNVNLETVTEFRFQGEVIKFEGVA